MRSSWNAARGGNTFYWPSALAIGDGWVGAEYFFKL